jgi:antitoxin component YwqK of YwqJK toxin-antitoxin module
MSKFIYFLFLFSFLACQENKKENLQKQYIYYGNGAIRRAFEVIDGKREGLMTDFYPDGKKKSECFLIQGIQVGKTTIYQKDGVSIREVQYYDDKGNRTKGDTLWYDNGTIEFIAQFANDKKNGVMSRFDTTGVLLYSAEFKDDSLINVLKNGIEENKKK